MNISCIEYVPNFPFDFTKSKLPKESVINVSQIITIDKSFLTDKVHTLSNKIMAQVDEGVKLVLKL